MMLDPTLRPISRSTSPTYLLISLGAWLVGGFRLVPPLATLLTAGVLLNLVGGCQALKLPPQAPRAVESESNRSRENVPLEERQDSINPGSLNATRPSEFSSGASLPDSLVVFNKRRSGFSSADDERLELSGWYRDFRQFGGTSTLPSGDRYSRPTGHPPHGMDARQADAQAASGYRWKHEKLDQLLAAEASEATKRERLLAATGDESPFVQSTAWIGLNRLEPGEHVRPLRRLVHDDKMPLEIRRAAVETLARTASVEEILKAADDLATVRSGSLQFRDDPQLYAELLPGFAIHGSEACAVRLRQAFEADVDAIRIAAFEVWGQRRAAGKQALPEEARRLLHEGSPAVRAAAVTAFGASGDPDRQPSLLEGLRDTDLSVRMAAIAALGQLDSRQANEALGETYREGGPSERAAVVVAWSRSAAATSVPWAEAAGDPAWQVRSAVAQSLHDRPSAEGEVVLRRLLQDSSATVQLQAALAAATWPRERAVPLLLEASKSAAYQTRESALKRLVEIWPEAEPLVSLRSARERTRMITRLEQRWNQMHDVLALANPETVESAADGLLQEAHQRAITQLRQGNAEARRRAAHELAQWSESRPGQLSRTSISELQAALRDEAEPTVWSETLKAVAMQETSEARELVRASLEHASDPVRLAGVRELIKHPDPLALDTLETLLDDSSVQVRAAAARAYAENTLVAAGAHSAVLAEVELQRRVERVKQLLAANEAAVRVAAAVALCRLNSASGPAAIERLALDKDPAVRRQVATAIGQLQDAQLLPILKRLLQDEPSVRRVAELQLQHFSAGKLNHR